MGSLQRIMGGGFFSFSQAGGAITSITPNCGYNTGGYVVKIHSDDGVFGPTAGQVQINGHGMVIVGWLASDITISVEPGQTGQWNLDVILPDNTIYTADLGFTFLDVPTPQNSKIKKNNPPPPVTITNLPASSINIIKKFSFDIENPMRRMWVKQQKSDRLVSLGQIQNIPEFVRVMWQALQIHRPSLVFEPAYPSYVLDSEDRDPGDPRPVPLTPAMPEEVITWNVIRRSPGSIDHTPFAKAREIRPRIREELVYDPWLTVDKVEPEMHHGPGQLGPQKELSRVMGYSIEGQSFDNLIQFDIWSKDNKKAEQLADYLEDFMHDFHGMFIELGVIKIHFQARVRDEFLLKWRNGLCNRSLLFYVKTETVRGTAVREIRKIHVETEVRTYLDEIAKLGPGAFFETSRNMIIDKWVKPQ